jgi:hypothetical protein
LTVERDCWFKHDGATADTANATALLQEFFDKRIVGRGLWPPRSPDLTPPDFFLLGFLKERVYSNNPGSLEELKHNIEQTVANIDSETLRIFMKHTKWVDAYLREGGGHFHNLL